MVSTHPHPLHSLPGCYLRGMTRDMLVWLGLLSRVKSKCLCPLLAMTLGRFPARPKTVRGDMSVSPASPREADLHTEVGNDRKAFSRKPSFTY